MVCTRFKWLLDMHKSSCEWIDNTNINGSSRAGVGGQRYGYYIGPMKPSIKGKAMDDQSPYNTSRPFVTELTFLD